MVEFWILFASAKKKGIKLCKVGALCFVLAFDPSLALFNGHTLTEQELLSVQQMS